MRIKLLIATADYDYIEHLSAVLSENHSDIFDINVCSAAERLRELLASNSYDAAMLEQSFVSGINLQSIHMPLILAGESEDIPENGLKSIRKYQRISSIVGNILENYADTGKKLNNFGSDKARITAVWSPAGGTGKTTIALAYAAHEVLSGKKVLYLNLENFSSISVYFKETGKSISKAFEKLESNVHMILMGIRQQDSGSGISYFCAPENYDDMNTLSTDDIATLIDACAAGTDELVVDLSSCCDARVQKVFKLADFVLLINDTSRASQVKLKQFTAQHNVFRQIQGKTVLINNKGTKTNDTDLTETVSLPFVQSTDPISIFKSLSSGNFDW